MRSANGVAERTTNYIPVTGFRVPLSSGICLVLSLLLLLLLLVPAHAESHHAPGQIFHAMLAGKLLLGPRKELPDLCCKWIVLLHPVDAAIGIGEAILKEGEESSTAQTLSGEGIGAGHVGLVLLEAGRGVARVWVMARLAAALSGSVVSGSGRPCTWSSWKTKVVLCYCWVHG